MLEGAQHVLKIWRKNSFHTFIYFNQKSTYQIHSSLPVYIFWAKLPVSPAYLFWAKIPPTQFCSTKPFIFFLRKTQTNPLFQPNRSFLSKNSTQPVYSRFNSNFDESGLILWYPKIQKSNVSSIKKPIN